MYSFPSASHNRAPAARSTTMGSPPTARNARTGLFTPPTRTSVARRKISSERGCSVLTGFGALIDFICSGNLKLAGFQPTREVLCVIGEHYARTRAMNASHNLEPDSLFIGPSIRGGRFHHGKFPAHVIRANGDVERLPDAMNDVQIRERRLHHNHVGALGEIEFNFTNRFPRVGRIHLVAAAVAGLRRRLRCLAERSIESRARFRRVAHDGDVFKAGAVESLA